MQNKIVFFGCGGHARSVADILLRQEPNFEIVFVDENARDNEKILGFNVLKDYNVTDEYVFPASGDGHKRETTINKYYDNLFSVVSPTAYIGLHARIGRGVVIGHNAHVGVESIIGDGVIVNTSASIDHEVTIGNFSHIAPNVTLCGRTKIGKNVFIGAGATVIDYISITDNVTVGAGGVVVKDIASGGIYVGCPVVKIKDKNRR